MAKQLNEFVASNGTKVLSDCNKNQRTFDAGSWLFKRGKLDANLAVANNKTTITQVEAKNMIALAVKEYWKLAELPNFGRELDLTLEVENQSVNPEYQAKRKMMIELANSQPQKAVKPNVALTQAQIIINGYNDVINAKLKSLEVIDYKALEEKIKLRVSKELQTEVLSAILPKSETPETKVLDFDF